MATSRARAVPAPLSLARPAVFDGPLALPLTHPVLGQVAASIFAELGLSGALMDGVNWYPIHATENAVRFEVAHAVEKRRWSYNARCVARVRREGRMILGQHAGFCDLFAPIDNRTGPCSLVVTGPFLLARPTSSEIASHWRALTGSSGRASDPEFRHYVSTTLATPVFDGKKLQLFKRALSRFTMLLEGRGDASRLIVEMDEQRTELRAVQLAETMFDQVRKMFDERTTEGASGPMSRDPLKRMGVAHTPEHVVVGLMLAPPDESADAIDGLIRRDAFQRACASLCFTRKGALAGRLGDYGVALVLDERGSSSRQRAKLADLAEQVRALARNFGFALHAGICRADAASDLPGRYQAALAAAEKGISEGILLVHAERGHGPGANRLRELRRNFAQAVRENPSLLQARFDRYMSALMAHCGYRIEPIRAHLEGAYDLIGDALRSAAALEERSLVELEGILDRRANEASTVNELALTYREGVASLELALLRPSDARRERSVGRATAYIRDHFAEPLTLTKVARVAGFAPTYFSALFAETERVSFHDHVRKLRLERARQMLASTTLSVERVGHLCGFRSRNRFHVAFKRSLGVTPSEYRSDKA